MRFKTLILGTAAAFAMVSGAQAADLAVAAPVGKSVCDAFGVGYYYIPGTDTCLKVSAYIRETMGYTSNPSIGAQSLTFAGNFWSQTEASIEATAKWMSAIGEGTIDVQMLEDTGGSSQTVNTQGVQLDHATAKIGGFTFGFQNTIAEAVGGWNDFSGWRNDHKTDNFGYIFSMGGVGVGFGVEDNNTYWHNDSPDFTGVITASLGGLAITGTAAYVNANNLTDGSSGEGFNIGATWGAAGGLQLAGNFGWSHNAGLFSGNSETGGNAMSAIAAFQAPIGGGTLLQGMLTWRDHGIDSANQTRAVLAVVVPVAQNLTISTEGYWDDSDTRGSSEGIFFRAKAATP